MAAHNRWPDLGIRAQGRLDEAQQRAVRADQLTEAERGRIIDIEAKLATVEQGRERAEAQADALQRDLDTARAEAEEAQTCRRAGAGRGGSEGQGTGGPAPAGMAGGVQKQPSWPTPVLALEANPLAQETAKQPRPGMVERGIRVERRINTARDSLPGERDGLPAGSLGGLPVDPQADENREPPQCWVTRWWTKRGAPYGGWCHPRRHLQPDQVRWEPEPVL